MLEGPAAGRKIPRLRRAVDIWLFLRRAPTTRTMAQGLMHSGGALFGRPQNLTAKSGQKLAQQIARWREIGGKGGMREFIAYARGLAVDARVAGTVVSGTVGTGPQALQNATIYRRGAEYLVTQGDRIMIYVQKADPGGIADESLRLEGH